MNKYMSQFQMVVARHQDIYDIFLYPLLLYYK